MTVAWDDASEGQGTDCDMDIEVETTWGVATDGTSMILTLNLEQTGYGAGHSLYAGFELGGVTYEVTEDGDSTYSVTYTDCY